MKSTNEVAKEVIAEAHSAKQFEIGTAERQRAEARVAEFWNLLLQRVKGTLHGETNPTVIHREAVKVVGFC